MSSRLFKCSPAKQSEVIRLRRVLVCVSVYDSLSTSLCSLEAIVGCPDVLKAISKALNFKTNQARLRCPNNLHVTLFVFQCYFVVDVTITTHLNSSRISQYNGWRIVGFRDSRAVEAQPERWIWCQRGLRNHHGQLPQVKAATCQEIVHAPRSCIVLSYVPRLSSSNYLCPCSDHQSLVR